MRFGTHEKDVERFDRWASTYDDSRLQKRVFRPVHDRVVELATRITPNASVILDVGCGTGQLLARLQDSFPDAHLLGVDAAPAMANSCNARGFPSATGRAEQLPFRSESVDLALSTMSLHHWTDQSLGLSEARRVLRLGGSFILVDGIVRTWLRPLFAVLRKRERLHTKKEIDSMLAHSGMHTTERSIVSGMWGGIAATVARRPDQ
ncbi:MAG: class I SAM-dependent methyltransferase [Actinomycetota bacterium]